MPENIRFRIATLRVRRIPSGEWSQNPAPLHNDQQLSQINNLLMHGTTNYLYVYSWSKLIKNNFLKKISYEIKYNRTLVWRSFNFYSFLF
jgi:hypothetical protein